MKRFICFAAILLMIALPSIKAVTLDSAKVTFGRDEGMAALDRIIREQGSDIRRLVGRHQKDTALYISVQGNADGVRYAKGHIKKNVAMAEERSVTGSTILEKFGADMGRVYSASTNIDNDTGSVHRYFILRLVTDGPPKSQTGLVALNGANEGKWNPSKIPDSTPPAPKKDTVVSYFGVSNVWIGIGIAYNGEKVVPMIYGQLGNDRLRFEAEGGLSIYQQTRTFQEELDVYYRYLNVGLVWRPALAHNWDVLLGWQRIETYSTKYGRYAEKREGPTMGLRYSFKHLAVTAKYTRAEVSVRGEDVVSWDDGVYLGVSLFTSVKGGKK